jgi:hypothetical protein
VKPHAFFAKARSATPVLLLPVFRLLPFLHRELEEQPEHPFTLFNLGMTYTDMGEYQKAVGFLNRCLEVSGACGQVRWRVRRRWQRAARRRTG